MPSVSSAGREDTNTRESLFLTCRGLQVPNPTAGEAASRQRGPVSLMIRCQQGIALIDEQTPNAKKGRFGPRVRAVAIASRGGMQEEFSERGESSEVVRFVVEVLLKRKRWVGRRRSGGCRFLD